MPLSARAPGPDLDPVPGLVSVPDFAPGPAAAGQDAPAAWRRRNRMRASLSLLYWITGSSTDSPDP